MNNRLLSSATLDHVGIVAPDTRLAFYDLVGGANQARAMPSGVEIRRFGHDRRLELVVPKRPGTPVDSFLETRGPGLHHLALMVDQDLGEVLERLRADEIETAGGIQRSSDERPSLFLHPRSTGGVLVELVAGPRT